MSFFMAHLYNGQNQSTHTPAGQEQCESCSHRAAHLIGEKCRMTSGAAELSTKSHLCRLDTMINAAKHEFKCPKDLACLFELSPGEAAAGTRECESCSGAPAGGPLLQRRSIGDDG